MIGNKKTQVEKINTPEIKKIILVTSGKGGVGKSTVSTGIALKLAEEGYSTGLLDADIFGPSIPTLFNINESEIPSLLNKNGKQVIEPIIKNGMKIMSIGFFFDENKAIVWRGPMVTNAIKQLVTETDWGNLDYLVIDTPPGTGDVLITLLQSFNITMSIVVTTPQKMAVADVKKAINMLQDEHIGTEIKGIVENMAWFSPSLHKEEKYYIYGEGGAQLLSDTTNLPIIAKIPINEHLFNSLDNGRTEELFNEKSISDEFDKLVDNILN